MKEKERKRFREIVENYLEEFFEFKDILRQYDIFEQMNDTDILKFFNSFKDHN